MHINIQLDFEIPKELISLYQQASHDKFIGYENPITDEEAEKHLTRYSLTRTYGRMERLGILKIWLDNKLIGFSFPRVIQSTEYRGFKLEETKLDWHRLGTIYIDEAVRGKGITSKVYELFKQDYPNLIWVCEDENQSSKRAALRAGFKHSHYIYFKDSATWSFDKDEEFVYAHAVFKS